MPPGAPQAGVGSIGQQFPSWSFGASKVSHQGHWGGSNQRAPYGVKQPCWNIERWFFFLVLTKWQLYQFHCRCQLRQEYLPGKCLFDIFFWSQDGWVHFRHAWTHLYRISPIWANINIPVSQAVAGSMDTPEGPAKSYKQKCQAACWKRLHHQSPGKDRWSHQAPHTPFLNFWELRNEVLVSVAPGTFLQPYLLLCKQIHHTAQRECQWALKWGVNTEKIDYFPSWRTSVSL